MPDHFPFLKEVFKLQKKEQKQCTTMLTAPLKEFSKVMKLGNKVTITQNKTNLTSEGKEKCPKYI